MATPEDILQAKIDIVKEKNYKLIDLKGVKLRRFPNELFELDWLEEIDLRHNKISLFPENIRQLTHLKRIYVENNPFRTLPNVYGWVINAQEWFKLQETLSPDCIAGIRLQSKHKNSLHRFTHFARLTYLRISGCALEEVPEEFISHFPLLEQLSFSDNLISHIPESIFNISSLNDLSFRKNELTDIPSGIEKLTSLRRLDLSSNPLHQLPDTVLKVMSLNELLLRDCMLTQIPEEITSLHQLKIINLTKNALTSIPDAICHLSKLKTLILTENYLTQLPKELHRLQNLERLFVGANELTEIPDSIQKLPKLERLSFRRNRLLSIPSFIPEMKTIRRLDLRLNDIKELPINLSQLTALEHFDISNNQIEFVPEEIAHIESLKFINVKENPLKDPPYETAIDGVEALRDFFEERRKGAGSHLYEAKLLILGEGGAGKTTLAKNLVDPDFQITLDQPSTEGIEVQRWEFQIGDAQRFRVNIWDFGGQEIYHATHQFFLTKRSLYVLVADTRREDTDFHYWMSIIELLSDKSPLLIVLNEKQDRTKELDERVLRGDFENLRDTLTTNLATKRGFPELIKSIQYHLQSLSHIGSLLPQSWVEIRSNLETDERNYIDVREYLDICRQHGMEDKGKALQLSDYLHDIGVFLHFQESDILRKTLILKPEWGTTAVYKVLDNTLVINNHGRFSREDLQEIWKEDEYDFMRAELLELMMKFELCYPLEGTEVFIAPQLLPVSKPDYPWDITHNVILRYKYKFMPKGLITRLMVRLHRYIEHQSWNWKTGMVLHRHGAHAEIVELYSQREIKIRMVGKNKRELLTIILEEMDNLHASYHKRLNVSKRIPCNCQECKGSQNPYFYDYDKLSHRLSRGREEIECDHSLTFVKVRSLIDDIQDPGIQLQSVKNEISKGNVQQAMDKLRQLYEDHPEVITLSGRWQSYRKQVNKGVLSHEQMMLDKSRIDQSLMALIEQLEEGE